MDQVKDDKKDLFLGLPRTHSKSKHLSEVIEAQEDFRLLVDNIRDYGIFMLDPNGRILTWNLGAERLKGYKKEEIIGTHFSCFYTPEDQARDHPAKELRIAILEGRYEEEGWRVKKDGTQFWANVVITPLHDKMGKLKGFGKVTHDLTERKIAEEKLKMAYEELELRVKDHTRALQHANEELESFSYSVSHDLRAPLRSMAGFSQALERYYSEKLDERGKDFLRRIRESSSRMGQLIEDILNLSKLGRHEISLREINLSSIVQKIATGYKRRDSGRIVEFKIAPDVRAYGDLRLIQIMLENLLENAWKYTSKTLHAVIEFGIHQVSPHPIYYVKDNGAGFDMAYSGKLFEAFQRLHLESEFPGTGIGLASVRRIIQRHGGDIWAFGEIGQGAKFYFTLGTNGARKA